MITIRPPAAFARLLSIGGLTARRLVKPAALTVVAHGLHLVQGNAFVRAINNTRGLDSAPGAPASAVVAPLAGAIGITGVELAAQYRRRTAWRETALDLRAGLRHALIEAVAAQDLAFFDEYGVQQLLDLITADTQAVADVVEKVPDQLIEKGMTALYAAVTLIALSPRFALSAALPLPLLLVPAIVLGPQMAQRFARSAALRGDYAQAVETMLSGITDVKLFTAENPTIHRLRELGARLNAAVLAATSSSTAVAMLAQGVGATSMAVVAAHGGALTRSGRISGEDFARILYLYPLLLGAIGDLQGLAGTWADGLAAAARVDAVLERRPRIVGGPGRLPAPETRGTLALEHVSFGYDAARTILHDVSFGAARGETVAIVGRSGSGKSTLLRLIARLYEAGEGRITLDGRDVREIDLGDLRESVALVSQETYLFEGSIRDNLRYGKADASDEELRAAMAKAGAGELLRRLPGGLDAEVGERGGRLSGGERQRVAIARTILRAAPVLLLDEITSHLDYETEDRIRRTVDRLAPERTIVTVTHRLATIRRASRIVVLDGGRVAETGTHRELLALGGVYAKLWRLQTGTAAPRKAQLAIPDLTVAPGSTRGPASSPRSRKKRDPASSPG